MKYIATVSVLLNTFMILIFNKKDLNVKRLLFLPINILSLMIGFIVHHARENRVKSLTLKTLLRISKFIIIYIFLYTLKNVFYVPHINIINIGLACVLIIDLIRAYIYELSKRKFNNKILSSIFSDILILEKYFQVSLLKKKSNDGFKEIDVNEFYRRGKPERIDHDQLFDLWNNEAVLTSFAENEYRIVKRAEDTKNNSDDNETIQQMAEAAALESRLMDASILNRKTSKDEYVNSPLRKQKIVEEKLCKDLKTLVNPEKYVFGYHDRGNTEIEEPLLNIQEQLEEFNIDIDSNEAISMDDSEFSDSDNEYQQRDNETSQWAWISNEVFRLNQKQPKQGLITKKSLSYHFGENADEVYRILTFNRTEELNYLVFKDNIRQINNERENLYLAIGSSKDLLSLIYYILIFIESLVIYGFVSTYLQVQPLFIKLCIPIFILPTLPSLKVIIESFLFIVYSHPYDPGDRVFIFHNNFIVRRISLLSTTFVRWDGMRFKIPNVIVRDRMLTNVRRSLNQTWKIEFLICSYTPENKLSKFKKLIKRFVKEDKAYSDVKFYVSDIVDSSYITVTIWITHSSNFQNGFLMWNNHSKFLKILTRALYIIKIKYLPIQQNIILKDEGD